MSVSDDIVIAALARRKRLAEQGRLPDQLPQPKKKRRHPKRHGENRERSLLDRTKAKEQAKQCVEYVAFRRLSSDIMRRYFLGELADLSSLPTPSQWSR